jgi:hypothetical protein
MGRGIVRARVRRKGQDKLQDLEFQALQRGLLPADVSGFHSALQDAIVRGFDQVFWVATGVALLGVAAACLVPPRSVSVRQPPERRLQETG